MRLRTAAHTMGWRMAKYIEILFRHRLRFLILLVVLPAELAVASVVMFPHVTAESSLWVDTPSYFGISPAATGWNQYLTPAQNTADSLNQLRSTGAFLKILGEDLDAGQTFNDAGERSAVLGTVTTDLRVAPTGSHLVILTYVCPRRPICVNVLASTTQIYRDWLAVKQQEQAKVAIDFYTGQLAQAQDALQADQAALNKYLAANPGLKPADAALIPEFDQLVRNLDQDRLEVTALKQKLDGLKLTNAAAAEIVSTVFNVVDQPHVVGGTLSSLPRKQIAIADIACLAIALAVLIGMAWTDRNVWDAKELQKRLRIPVVATVPDLATAVITSG
jgi:hypothetical protein